VGEGRETGSRGEKLTKEERVLALEPKVQNVTAGDKGRLKSSFEP